MAEYHDGRGYSFEPEKQSAPQPMTKILEIINRFCAAGRFFLPDRE